MILRNSDHKLQVLLVGLFSTRYPAAGETHGLSVAAGAIHAEFSNDLTAFEVLDLVTIGREDTELIRDRIAEVKPNVLGLSVPYGTYDVLLNLMADIRLQVDRGGLVIIGGALATYIGPRILDEIDNRIVIVQGEGDESAPAAIHAWRKATPLHDVPNVLFTDDGTKVATKRSMTNPTSIVLPYREHLRQSIAQGIQVYSEASRGCSWAACTFCLRGLTDVKGTAKEYRRLPLDRIRDDMRKLRDMGADQITFADEDFIGGDSESLSKLLDTIARVQAEDPDRRLAFDVSATTRSIFDESDSTYEKTQKLDRLHHLREIGLNKVFLGVESGSPPQLKRYAKGHTPAEIIVACRAVVDSGLRLELGFIMFDPLCSPEEIIENVTFLLDNKLAANVSGPTSELRLQVGSRYINLLTRAERQLGRQLFKRDVDPNTLSHDYVYANSEIGQLASAVKCWDQVTHPFVYATKGLTRHGRGVLPPDVHERLNALLGKYRQSSLQALRAAAQSGQPADYRTGTISALTELVHAARGITCIEKESMHPMISQLEKEAEAMAVTLNN